MKKLLALVLFGVLLSSDVLSSDAVEVRRGRSRSRSIVSVEEFFAGTVGANSSQVPSTQAGNLVSTDGVEVTTSSPTRKVSFAAGTKEKDGPRKYSSSVVSFFVGYVGGAVWQHKCDVTTTVADIAKAYQNSHSNRCVRAVEVDGFGGMEACHDAKIVDLKKSAMILKVGMVFVPASK